MTKICLCVQIHIPVILRSYRFFDINHIDHYYDDFSVDYHANRIYIDNLLPFFETIKKLFIESEGRFKVAISISGITLKLLQKFVPEAITDLADLEQNGCIEFLSESWSHSMVAFSDPETLAGQTQLHDEMIKSLFGKTPDVFIVHSPVCPEKIWRTIPNSGGKRIFMSSNHIDKTPVKPNVTNKTTPSNKGVFLINYALSQTLQNMDSNPDKQIRIFFASRIFRKFNNRTPSPDPQILIYNPAILGRPFDRKSAVTFESIVSLILFDPDLHFLFPSEMKTAYPCFIGNDLSKKEAQQFKLPVELWLKNDLQKEAFKEQLSLHKRMQTCTKTSLIEDWNLLQDMEHLYYMSNQFFLKKYAENNFNPYASPYLAFMNYMNVLADFTGRIERKSLSVKRIIKPVLNTPNPKIKSKKESTPKSPSSLIFNLFTPAPKGKLVENQRTLQSPLHRI